MTNKLPMGQHAIAEFPPFGLTQFANRIPKEKASIGIEIVGDVQNSLSLSQEFELLERAEQLSDFHCVTTWSSQGQRWGGYRFSEFYEKIILPQAQPNDQANILIFKGDDGAGTGMLLEDLLGDDVLLADTLNEEPLSLGHGGPLRLIAPKHYGYKSIKYLCKIEFCRNYANYRPNGFRFMDHPRARVEFEERGKWVPGWLLRYLYRPLIPSTIKLFKTSLKKHALKQGGTPVD